MNLSDKHIIVTGGAGFLGSFLVEKLNQIPGARVFVIRSRDYDLTNVDDVRKMYNHIEPDVVFHLAAEVGGIGANQKNPGRFFYANAIMGIHLIEEGRIAGLKKFVQLGTVCSFPKFTPVPFKEDDLWNGYPEETNAPYGIAKKALLVMLQAYRNQYGFNGIYLLPVNLYGPRDNFDPDSSHVIPALIKKCLEAKESGTDISVWGTGSASREFLYVEDCVAGLILAAQKYDGPEPINLGPSDEETKISELIQMIVEIINFRGNIAWDKTKPDGQPRRSLDTTRAEKLLGFKAKTRLKDGLRETIRWYLKNG